MKLHLKEKFIIDKKGKKTAVVLDGKINEHWRNVYGEDRNKS